MKKITTIVLLIGLSIGSMYAATASKGVFSVSSTRKVQFANANSIYSASQLIQWEFVDDIIASESGWDVLTGDEWSYLLASGRTNAANLNNLGLVDGQNGLIILPDGWVQPDGVPTFSPAEDGEEYSVNTYTAEQWAVMAESGAIFLPCAGYGYHDPDDDDKYKEVNTTDHGCYWAKDAYDASDANCMRFNEVGSGSIHDLNHQVKTAYYCVILVKTVPKIPELYEEHEASDFEDDIEAARGSDSVLVHRTLVKDSTLYTLCLPFDVPNIDESPLVGAEIFEFKGGRVTGTTGNEVLNLNMSRLQGKRLIQGVPYILRWAKTTPVDTLKVLRFDNVENWDEDEETATDPGNTTVKFHGVYPKAHIAGYESAAVAHYNFFIGANNTLYWPDDAGGSGTWATHKMKGFRGYFYITPGGGPSPVSRYRNMPAVWSIEEEYGSTTGVQNTDRCTDRIQTEKLFQDGQIVLIFDGVKYDMQGRKVER